MKTETIELPDRSNSREQALARRKAGSRRRSDPAQMYSKVVERYALLFERPEARLRFLNHTLAKQAARQAQLDQSLRFARFLERTRLYDWILEAQFYKSVLEEFRAFEASLPHDRRRQVETISVPLSARLYSMLYQTRHAFYALLVVVAGLLLFAVYSLASWSARHVNGYLAQKYQRYRAPIVVTTAGQGAGTAFAATGAKYLPGYKPERVWLVETTPEFERYSNGARILTRYETENHIRGYYLIPRGADTAGDQLRRDVVGIVYHTSESDIVPFTSANNQSIKYRSQGLLDYIQRNKSYNYLIDRYGEVYRIVRDDHAAHHAGHSVWADERYDYVGLNESFIGICFESTSTAGSLEETLTEAQIVSGRALTNVLRSKYNIEDVNCTTHGLVSINPDKMLIAFHHDWVRNFPFEAMGLSDKYKVPPANMIDYGFSYDEEILQKLGNVLWPGAVTAEEEFRKRIERSRANGELLRRKLRDRYLAQLEKTRQLRAPSGQENMPLSTAESNR